MYKIAFFSLAKILFVDVVKCIGCVKLMLSCRFKGKCGGPTVKGRLWISSAFDVPFRRSPMSKRVDGIAECRLRRVDSFCTVKIRKLDIGEGKSILILSRGLCTSDT